MSQKGNTINIVVDPESLLPAVTHTKLKYHDLSSRIAGLQAASRKILDDGVLDGPRMAQEKALAETILQTCTDITDALERVGISTDQILSSYVSIEGQAAVQRVVAQATEQVQAQGGKDGIKTAGKNATAD